MTNGEKMQEMFPEGKTRRCRGGVVFESDGWCHAYDSDWWNTEYKGPVIYDDALPSIPYATPDNCGNYIEQTTINDSGVNHTINSLDDFIEFGKKAFGVELTVTPQEPRKGHWVIKDKMWWVCSACGCQTRMMKKYNVPNFCPACGADMREVEE